MKCRILFTGLMILCGPGLGRAQVKDSATAFPFWKNTISVNGTALLERLFKENLVPDLNTSFLYYQRDFRRFFLRAGVNGWSAQRTESNPSANEDIVRNNFFTSATLGCYRTHELSRSFSAAYGLNLLGGYVDSSVTIVTTVDAVRNYTISKHFGLAPGVLLKYRITSRISVFAEYTMPVTMTLSESGTHYSLFPEENTTDRRVSGFNILFYNPLNIYLSCSF